MRFGVSSERTSPRDWTTSDDSPRYGVQGASRAIRRVARAAVNEVPVRRFTVCNSRYVRLCQHAAHFAARARHFAVRTYCETDLAEIRAGSPAGSTATDRHADQHESDDLLLSVRDNDTADPR